MEKHLINIPTGKNVEEFELREYVHHSGETCTLQLYQDDVLVAAFQPDERYFLHLCKNPGVLGEIKLNRIAEYLEEHFPFGRKAYSINSAK